MLSNNYLITSLLITCFSIVAAHAQENEKIAKLHNDLENIVDQANKLKAMAAESEEQMVKAREKGDHAEANQHAVKLAAIRTQIKTTDAARNRLETMIQAVRRTDSYNRQREEARRRATEERREMERRRDRNRNEQTDERRVDTENRIQNLRRAIEHLRAAGMNDLVELSERTLQKLEVQLQRERDERNRIQDRPRDRERADRDPFGDDDRDPFGNRRRSNERRSADRQQNEVLGAIRELNEAVKQMREELNDLKRKVDGRGRGR